MMKNTFFLILLHILCISWINADPLVQVRQGVLSGTIQKSRNGKEYSAFLGIPYAQPPIGDLRFKSPQNPLEWNGTRSANSFGNICPQLRHKTLLGSEDCLFLNVYTPLKKFSTSSNMTNESTLLPVMVFIHGGGLLRGSSNYYTGEYLLDNDVILVTMNFRLGMLGFFSTGDSEAPGNFGLKDQVLALKWVQKNIKSFGGNANKVTLFGQSSGANCVGLHLFSKQSKGLFQQYILQSGNPLTTWAYKKRSDFVQQKKTVAQLLSCSSESSNELVSCLKKRNVISLLNISTNILELSYRNKFWWKPTDEDDAEDAFLTDNPLNLLRKNEWLNLPSISGGVFNEGSIITSLLHSIPSFYYTIRSNLDSILLVADHLDSLNKTRFIKAVKDFYFKKSYDAFEKHKFIQDVTEFVNDGYHGYPQLKMLENQISRMAEPAYFYSFIYRGQKTTSLEIRQYLNAGAVNGDDLFYLFPFLNGSPSTIEDLEISKVMVDLWTSFAENGKPVSKTLQKPDLWIPYKYANTYLQIGDRENLELPTVQLSNTFHNSSLNFWRENSPFD